MAINGYKLTQLIKDMKQTTPRQRSNIRQVFKMNGREKEIKIYLLDRNKCFVNIK